jgi:RNA polymerase sigma factor (TIGR02999 family)
LSHSPIHAKINLETLGNRVTKMATLNDTSSEVTALLAEIRAGNEQARQQLVERIYQELHQVAVGLMQEEPANHTLQPTALLHEAFGRLFSARVFEEAPNRAYLFGAAVRAMREILVEHARSRNAAKRGGGQRRLPLDAIVVALEEQKIDVLALHDALNQLAEFHERQSQVVTLRFLFGFTVEEVAGQLGVSLSTVESDFRIARAWLRGQLRDDG